MKILLKKWPPNLLYTSDFFSGFFSRSSPPPQKKTKITFKEPSLFTFLKGWKATCRPRSGWESGTSNPITNLRGRHLEGIPTLGVFLASKKKKTGRVYIGYIYTYLYTDIKVITLPETNIFCIWKYISQQKKGHTERDHLNRSMDFQGPKNRC